MKCGRNGAAERLQTNRGGVATEVSRFTFLSLFCPICGIYGMINFCVAMETARQQSVPASRKWRPEQKGSNERKRSEKNIDAAAKNGGTRVWGGEALILFLLPIVCLERRDELKDEI